MVYWFFPETAGRSLEGKSTVLRLFLNADRRKFIDMDVIFALAYKEGVSPVQVSLRKDLPAAGTPEADEILGISTPSSEKRERAL